MAYRLGITGMDSSTEAELRSAFALVQPRLSGRWELVPESDADHVVVDMDSMYGPMSWIRLHAAGKQVIGLTTSPRTQADHRLPRPFDGEALATLLASIAGAPATTPADPPAISPETAEPLPSAAAATPAPAPADLLPEERTIPDSEESHAPAEPAATLEPAPSAIPAPATETRRDAASDPTPREHGLADWLAPGALQGRWQLARGGARIAFDADARRYHGPAGLKPLAALFEGTVARDELQSMDAGAWESVATGEALPLSRLRWYGGLLAGKGALLSGHDPDGKYRLLKWPQTEREFPKHFRIATAMMKGPATVAEVAAASGVDAGEVADFVNASLATGYAEFVPPAAPEPVDPPRSGGLFGRLRGR